MLRVIFGQCVVAVVCMMDGRAAADEWLVAPYGVTRQQVTLEAELDASMLDVGHPKSRVLLIGFGDGQDATSARMRQFALSIQSLIRDEKELSDRVSISVIARAYPHGLPNPIEFPPTGKAYDDTTQPESIYLWRWLGMLAPDLVVEVVPSDEPGLARSNAGQGLAFLDSLKSTRVLESKALFAALSTQSPCDVGSIPSLRIHLTKSGTEGQLLQVLRAYANVRRTSPARDELLRRRKRSSLEVANELARTYGHQLNEVAYIPALSLVGRMRLGQLTNDDAHLRDVERIVKPYYSGDKVVAKSGGSQQAGHLVFGELMERTGDAKYLSLLKAAADLGFDNQGRMREATPGHSEMSDAVFMATPILAQTARLSQEAKYREMALKHLRFMVHLNQRPDGLHQHSPVAPDHTAWGRGNGFVTLGLVLALSELPEQGAEHDEALKLYREHLAAMLKHQDSLGMWHQVVDHPESYREFTVTCMTTFSITRGLRRGWLDRATFEPVVRRAWPSIKQRIGPNGSLVDVCTGTGKMKSLREYLDRPATLGKDDRGGAMAFMVSTELAFAEREGKLLLQP